MTRGKPAGEFQGSSATYAACAAPRWTWVMEVGFGRKLSGIAVSRSTARLSAGGTRSQRCGGAGEKVCRDARWGYKRRSCQEHDTRRGEAIVTYCHSMNRWRVLEGRDQSTIVWCESGRGLSRVGVKNLTSSSRGCKTYSPGSHHGRSPELPLPFPNPIPMKPGAGWSPCLYVHVVHVCTDPPMASQQSAGRGGTSMASSNWRGSARSNHIIWYHII